MYEKFAGKLFRETGLSSLRAAYTARTVSKTRRLFVPAVVGGYGTATIRAAESYRCARGVMRTITPPVAIATVLYTATTRAMTRTSPTVKAVMTPIATTEVFTTIITNPLPYFTVRANGISV